MFLKNVDEKFQTVSTGTSFFTKRALCICMLVRKIYVSVNSLYLWYLVSLEHLHFENLHYCTPRSS